MSENPNTYRVTPLGYAVTKYKDGRFASEKIVDSAVEANQEGEDWVARHERQMAMFRHPSSTNRLMESNPERGELAA